MDKYICQICKKEIQENKHFWKEHKIKEADYYQEYHPRYSKQTNQLIKFKNRDFYFSSDFNDKKEMMVWFKDNPELSKEYAVNLLAHRKEKKNLVYAPSHVELRSILAPSMIWFKKNLGNYKELCERLNYQIKFDREDDVIGYGEFPESAKIIIDTREQLPLKFNGINTEIKKLDYGDYARFPNRYKIHVERKNLSDFVGTLGVGYERFCREIARAKKEGAYLIVLVEALLNNALHFNYLPHMKYSKVSPDYIFHHVREMMQTYSNLQFVFCAGRIEAAELIKKIFCIKKHPKHYDLQYYYDTKQL